jgi:hypothetical protein
MANSWNQCYVYNPRVRETFADILESIHSQKIDQRLPVSEFKKYILNQALWACTERYQHSADDWSDIKFKQPMWSTHALAKLQANIDQDSNTYTDNLRHEHAVPRRVLTEVILALRKPSGNAPPVTISQILNVSYAVILTKEEADLVKTSIVGAVEDAMADRLRHGDLPALETLMYERYEKAGIFSGRWSGNALKLLDERTYHQRMQAPGHFDWEAFHEEIQGGSVFRG